MDEQDIVTRLRQFGDSYGLSAEAADEIEKLRAEVNTMACAQDGWGQLGRLKAENEQLRVLIGELEDALPDPPPQQGTLIGSKRLAVQPNKKSSDDTDRLRQVGDKLAMHLDAFFGMLEPASNEITDVLKEWKEARRG